MKFLSKDLLPSYPLCVYFAASASSLHFSLSSIFSVFLLPYAVVKVLRRLVGSGLRWEAGGDNEIRTRDLLLARQALSQLSYAPVWVSGTGPED